ncbi:acetyltransferase [Flavobacterium psychrolimnae]|uniref:Acetyltransferase n=1 Tax=Flavobacterium psychrolimnae TaxID=249351 RepID=A0A366AXL5_9FLAO|nr:acetyltransferase [Flavobacterium psychrolimnae]
MYLYGASGHCKVIIDVLQSNKQAIIAIIDDVPKMNQIFTIPVIYSGAFVKEPGQKFIVSIGDNAIRKKIVHRIVSDYHIALHPTAVISEFSTIGAGSVIMAGAIINADAVVGQHCIINTAAVIEHDCKIGNFVHVSPNAALAGGVTVGEGTHIGIGAIVIQGIKIGKWVTIGAGAILLNDVPDYAIVVGNPGKIIKYNKEHE